VDTKRDDSPSRLGLRERKQVKTRGLLQAEALRLFREQGYAETSVNEIAEAVEVSPSTFYRYFPTKEDVVLYDAFDPILLEALRAQPSELNLIGAVRAAMTSVLGSSSGAMATQMQERSDLMLAVPELRRGMLDAMLASVEPLAQVLGRAGGALAGRFRRAQRGGGRHRVGSSPGLTPEVGFTTSQRGSMRLWPTWRPACR